MTAMEQFHAYLNQIHPLNPVEMDLVEDIFQVTYLKKDDYFAEVGELSQKIGLLGKGILRAYYQAPSGQQYNKTLFVPPCFVGALSSLASGTPNKIYIQALTDCEVWTADYHRMVALYDEYPGLERLNRRLTEFVFIEKEEREIELVVNNATERYLFFLERFGDFAHQIPLFHVASYLGITPTQLSRVRAALAKGEA